MKKSFVILLAALMLCGLTAIAEEAAPQETTFSVIDGYAIEAVVPEGYNMATYDINLGMLVALTPEDPTQANVIMTVTRSEELDGMTLNAELTEEQEAQLRQTLVGDAVNPEITNGVTAHGTHLIMIHEKSDVDEYLVVLTVWNGYIIEMDVFPGEGLHTLTQEQIDTAVQFISDFFIVEKVAE